MKIIDNIEQNWEVGYNHRYMLPTSNFCLLLSIIPNYSDYAFRNNKYNWE